jgi:PIN domain nuclease of toxin-antitoxin system
MKILLDTHAFIWFAEDDAQLPDSLKRVIESPSNEIYLSILHLGNGNQNSTKKA